MNTETIISNSVEETITAARGLAATLAPGAVLALHGDLGSGKTCFVSGIAEFLGIDDPITSPTFTIINEYEASLPLFHMDLYRISGPDEIFSLDLDSYLNANGITVIEWPERAGDLLPPDTINIHFETLTDQNTRRITISKPKN